MRSAIALPLLLLLAACRGREVRPPVPPAAPAPVQRCAVSLDAPARARIGERSVAHLRLRGTPGFHVNHDAPLQVVAAAPELEIPRARFGVGEAAFMSEDEVRVDIPYVARASGTKALAVSAHFGVCGGGACAMCAEERRALTVVD